MLLSTKLLWTACYNLENIMFEDVLDKYKDDLTEALVACGEAHRVHKILSDVEMNREDFFHFYKEGYESSQEKLDKVLAPVQKYIDYTSCSQPNQYELGVLEVASEIEEALKYDF